MDTNLFEGLAASMPAEMVDVLVQAPSVRIERIVSTGHASPDGFWYDQPEQEWVIVLAGEAVLEFLDREPVRMKAGDHIHLAAHRKHRGRLDDAGRTDGLVGGVL